MRLVRAFGVGIGLFTCRRDNRRSADELDVSYTSDSIQKSARVKDLSPTGIFILTGERLALGQRIPLTLKRWSLPENSPQLPLRLFAKAVRYGKDGVGLTFLYGDSESKSWLNLVDQASPLVERRDAMRMLRVTAALAYLSRICPANCSESLKLILDEMVYETGETALDILIGAEEIVSRRQQPTRSDVSPRVIHQILSNGARTEEKWFRNFWAGLLAAASLTGANDEKSLENITLLSQLDSVQLRIFATACTRSTQVITESGEMKVRPLACKAEQISWLTGVSDLIHIECALDRLHQVGLLEKTVKQNPFALLDVANLTPTRDGLTFYAKCRGMMQPPSPAGPTEQISLFATDDSMDEAEMLPVRARLSFA
jgi:hypothetical protein